MMIARALMHDPRVLFLDEPTTGLDPAARLFVWDRIRELRQAGVTIVLTTHDMDEATALTDRVGIVDSGRLLTLDTPRALVRGTTTGTTLQISVELATQDQAAYLVERLSTLAEVQRCEQLSVEGTEHTIRLYLSQKPAVMVAPVATAIAILGGRLTAVEIGEATLEDVFIELTGRSLR
jgi:ABC-2 type transport system ATP-binding protein